MAIKLFTKLAVSYGLLLTLAAGGFAFANIFGFVATAISFGGETAPDTTPIRTSMNIGWCFGVCIGLLGAIMQFRRRRAKQTSHGTADMPPEESEQSVSEGRRQGLLVSAAWGGFFGVVLGAALGASFVLLWFSIAYSPFAPNDWAASTTVQRQRVGKSIQEVPVALTDHPVALYAFGLPVVIGAIGGAIFGGVVRVSDE